MKIPHPVGIHSTDKRLPKVRPFVLLNTTFSKAFLCYIFVYFIHTHLNLLGIREEKALELSVKASIYSQDKAAAI